MPEIVPDWPPSLWPAGERELLLQALFHSDPDVARDAWLKWELAVDFDDIDWAYIRVLPAMRRRWNALKIESANAGRIDGMHRFIWARTQLCLHQIAPLLAALAKGDVPVLVIKGCARALSDLPNRTERVTNDVDIAFQKPDLARALEIVEQAGWSCPWDISSDGAHQLLRLSRHSLPYRHEGQEVDILDIHGSALFSNRCVDHDDTLWARSKSVVFRGNPVRIPCEADQLIIACTHGLFFEHEPKPMDWVADCVDLLNAPGVVENPDFWEIVVSETARRDLYPNVYAGLSFLATRLGQPIPRDVLDALESGLTQPFVAECVGCARSGDAQTAEVRAAWGAAFIERSVKSAERLGQSPQLAGAAPSPVDQAAWETSSVGRENRYDVPAPSRALVEVAHASGQKLTLELRVASSANRKIRTAELALLAMEMHVVELGRTRLKRPLLSRRREAAFTLDPALFLIYDLDRVWAEFVESGTISQIDPSLPGSSLDFRWRI